MTHVTLCATYNTTHLKHIETQFKGNNKSVIIKVTKYLLFQDLAHGLGELLCYEGNVEEDFYLTFQVWTSPMY